MLAAYQQYSTGVQKSCDDAGACILHSLYSTVQTVQGSEHELSLDLGGVC